MLRCHDMPCLLLIFIDYYALMPAMPFIIDAADAMPPPMLIIFAIFDAAAMMLITMPP